MPLKPFEKNDIFKNVIKAHPRFQFKISSGEVFINNAYKGYVSLNELNLEAGCSNINGFDFSCEENSYLVSII